MDSDDENFLQYIEVIEIDGSDGEESDAESVLEYKFMTPIKRERDESVPMTNRTLSELKDRWGKQREERSSTTKRVTPVVPRRPVKKARTEIKAEKKEIKIEGRKKNKEKCNRKENEAAAMMILEKSDLFQIEWNNCEFLFEEHSEQKYYFSQLRTEAEKVRKLSMPIKCYTEFGLKYSGIGVKTAEIMPKLLDADAMWKAVTTNKKRKLYLVLD